MNVNLGELTVAAWLAVAGLWPLGFNMECQIWLNALTVASGLAALVLTLGCCTRLGLSEDLNYCDDEQ